MKELVVRRINGTRPSVVDDVSEDTDHFSQKHRTNKTQSKKGNGFKLYGTN